MNRYEHTQLGHVIIWSLLPFIVLVGSGAFVGSLYHRQPPLVVLIILVAALLLFYKLTIKIEDETLCASLGIGIIRKRIRLADIAGREAIRIRWWYGWGIHLTPYGCITFQGSTLWRSHCVMAESLHWARTIPEDSRRQFSFPGAHRLPACKSRQLAETGKCFA